MINIKHDSKGFTLIEIVIAIGILLVGILAVLALFPIGFDSANRSSDLTKAAIFAQFKIEDMKRIGYPVTAVGTAASFSDPRFTYTVQVSTAGLPVNCQQVTLGVSWDYKGKPHNEDFVTIISKLIP